MSDGIDKTRRQGCFPLKRLFLNHTRQYRGSGSETFSLKSDQLPNLIVAVACFCLLAGALALKPPHPNAPDVRLGPVPLPSMCTFKNLTGHPCPGCGLVRSMTAMAHGDVTESISHHRLGWLVLAYVFVQFFYRLVLLVNPACRTRLETRGKWLNHGLIVLAGLLALNWVITYVA